MSNREKAKRALYLKGIMNGNTATIELSQTIGSRTPDGQYIKVGNIGDKFEATMVNDTWAVKIKVEGYDELCTFSIPLEHGKIR